MIDDVEVLEWSGSFYRANFAVLATESFGIRECVYRLVAEL